MTIHKKVVSYASDAGTVLQTQSRKRERQITLDSFPPPKKMLRLNSPVGEVFTSVDDVGLSMSQKWQVTNLGGSGDRGPLDHPLHRESYLGDNLNVSLLLQMGFSAMDTTNNHHATPLMEASRGGRPEVVDKVLSTEEGHHSINFQDSKGLSAQIGRAHV